MRLTDLLKSRRRLAEELAARRAAAALAERSVSLADIAAKKAPELLETIRRRTDDTPRFSTWCAPDDILANRKELVTSLDAEGALLRFIEDLPTIKAHWLEKAKVAAA